MVFTHTSVVTHGLSWRLARLTATVGAVLLGACTGDELLDPPFRDEVRPRVSATAGNYVADSLLGIKVSATDNMGLKKIRVVFSGGLTATYDTVFNTTVTTLALDVAVRVPRTAPIGGTVTALTIATDGAGNLSDTARTTLTIGNLQPPVAAVLSPVAASPVVVGKALIVSLSGKARYKVRIVGYQITGAYTVTDSVTYRSPFPDSIVAFDTLVVPDTVKGATMTVTPFIVDSLDQRVIGTPVSYAVLLPSGVTTLPVVRTVTPSRVEMVDSVFVEATDPVGISVLGFEVRNAAGQLLASDSVSTTGGFTTFSRRFRMRVPVPSYPTSVFVTGFARNAGNRRDQARFPSGTVRQDTTIVVAGYTSALPQGGRVADAIYMPRADRLYLSNIDRNWLEVYNLADSSFRAPIAVGSRPWGLAAWPRSRDGDVGDTILVANSGGTNLSYVDLLAGGTGREVFRYALPNLIAYKVSFTKGDSTKPSTIKRVMYDFSDRPQYLAATCTGGTTAGSPCQDVMAVYSTTPTPGQSGPFASKGTLRWENLTRRSSHLFFEHALGMNEASADTLEVQRYAANGVGADSTIVPFDTLRQALVVRLDALAFRDTTFVRNSGNFRRAVFAEGGAVLGSRVLNYDATAGFDLTWPVPVIDRGVSRAGDVTDFIANSFSRVEGVGINFDGELSAVKGDSTYLLDRTLRLQGILESRSGLGGLDFHPLNAGTNMANLRARLSFVASSEPVIDVFDTHCYRRIAQVAIREPIIGPVRATVRPNGQLVLVGATRRGVTVVALADTFTTTCQ
jgi:hypothetical protein